MQKILITNKQSVFYNCSFYFYFTFHDYFKIVCDLFDTDAKL